MRLIVTATLICVAPCSLYANEADPASVRLQQIEHGEDLALRLKAMEESLGEGTVSEHVRLLEALLRINHAVRAAMPHNAPLQSCLPHRDNLVLLERFLRSTSPLRGGDPEVESALVRLAESIVASDYPLTSHDLRPRAFDVMIANCASNEEIRRKTMDCVERDQEWSWYHVEARLRATGQLDDDLLDGVRPILCRCLERNGLNRTALRLAAECGDIVVLPHLRNAIARDKLSRDDQFIARQAMWKIEIQNPPTRLIEFLEDANQDHWAIWHHDGTAWVVRKAVEHGLPRADIERAVKQYYAKCDPETLRRMRMIGLDRAVVELGVMMESELPDREFIDLRLPIG